MPFYSGLKQVVIFGILLMCSSQLEVKAQQSDENAKKLDAKHKNYVGKGDLSLGVFYFRNPLSAYKNAKYEASGAETNLVYYPFNKIGIEAHFGSFRYQDKPGNANALQQDPRFVTLDRRKVLTVGSSIRYNFLEKYHCGTLYLQSGYSFGWFEDGTGENIQRWEIATIGFTTSVIRKFIPNLDADFRIGVAKDNLHSNLPKLYKVGLSYQFGSIRKPLSSEI